METPLNFLVQINLLVVLIVHHNHLASFRPDANGSHMFDMKQIKVSVICRNGIMSSGRPIDCTNHQGLVH